MMLTHRSKKELARDILALGSVPFYFIVVARATIGKYFPFVFPMLIGFAAFALISFIIKDTNKHIALGLILVTGTSRFYRDIFYTFFVSFIWLGMVYSARYMKYEKKNIINGVLVGVICSTLTYYLMTF